MHPSVKAVTLPDRITKNLPIVKLNTRVELGEVLSKFPPELYYYARDHNPGFSEYKAGPVGLSKQHVTVQYGLMLMPLLGPDEFSQVIKLIATKSGMPYSAVADRAAEPWAVDGLAFDSVDVWDPPQDAVARGEPPYRCVVLKLKMEPNSPIDEMRKSIRRVFMLQDQWGGNSTMHITVAYVLDPLGEQQTVEAANRLAADLTHAFIESPDGTPLKRPVLATNLVADDNGFELYGTMPRTGGSL